MYSWRPEEALNLLGISVPNRSEVMLTCPKCGGKRFAFNLRKGIGRCFSASCEFSADSASFYAVSTGMTLNEARKDIEKRLGIDNSKESLVERQPRIVYNTKHEEVEIAPDDVLDKTYRAFLSELHLTEKNKSMLNARGLNNATIEALNYRTFPRMDEIDYFALCRRMLENGYTLKGVPGFYKTKRGDYSFVQLTKGIIMPLVNRRNQITGLQIRKDDDLRIYIEETGDLEQKCAWLSSKNRDGGSGAKAKVHYACDFAFNRDTGNFEPVIPDKGVMLTEGIMKADITHMCLPHIPVISVPGVNALTYLEEELKFLKSIGVETIIRAYDMDYMTNPNVQSALQKTDALIERLGLKNKPAKWDANIFVDGKEVNINGIDDYMVYTKFGIVPQVKKK